MENESSRITCYFTPWQKKYMQICGLFLVRAHFGWMNFLLRKFSDKIYWTAPFARRINELMSRRTDRRSLAFDVMYKTMTVERGEYAVSENVPVEERCWGYGPINQDFFREIMRAVPIDFSRYCFVDVGAGKGVALMLASEFGFHRIVGVELSSELIEIGKNNIARYNRSTGCLLDPVWERADFLKWKLPNGNSLFFFNNPLPKDIALQAVRKIVEKGIEMDLHFIIVYRKPSGEISDYLASHPRCCALRLSPYWQIYGVGLRRNRLLMKIWK